MPPLVIHQFPPPPSPPQSPPSPPSPPSSAQLLLQQQRAVREILRLLLDVQSTFDPNLAVVSQPHSACSSFSRRFLIIGSHPGVKSTWLRVLQFFKTLFATYYEVERHRLEFVFANAAEDVPVQHRAIFPRDIHPTQRFDGIGVVGVNSSNALCGSLRGSAVAGDMTLLLGLLRHVGPQEPFVFFVEADRWIERCEQHLELQSPSRPCGRHGLVPLFTFSPSLHAFDFWQTDQDANPLVSPFLESVRVHATDEWIFCTPREEASSNPDLAAQLARALGLKDTCDFRNELPVSVEAYRARRRACTDRLCIQINDLLSRPLDEEGETQLVIEPPTAARSTSPSSPLPLLSSPSTDVSSRSLAAAQIADTPRLPVFLDLASLPSAASGTPPPSPPPSPTPPRKARPSSTARASQRSSPRVETIQRPSRPGRMRFDLTPHQLTIVERLLEDRDWILAQLDVDSVGLGGLREQSFCLPEWLPHFNIGGAANSLFHATNQNDEAAVRVRDNLASLSKSLARSLGEAVIDGFLVRAASGWQFTFSRRGSRGLHTDLAHLGWLILSVTLEGDCTINVEDVLADRPVTDPPWSFTQEHGQCYALWGASRDNPTRHAVIAGIEPRLSVTLRFPAGSPPPSGLLLPGQSWALDDVCEARFMAKDYGEPCTQWYAGKISAIDERRQLFSVRFDDGDTEDSVPLRFIRRVQSTTAEDRASRRSAPSPPVPSPPLAAPPSLAPLPPPVAAQPLLTPLAPPLAPPGRSEGRGVMFSVKWIAARGLAQLGKIGKAIRLRGLGDSGLDSEEQRLYLQPLTHDETMTGFSVDPRLPKTKGASQSEPLPLVACCKPELRDITHASFRSSTRRSIIKRHRLNSSCHQWLFDRQLALRSQPPSLQSESSEFFIHQILSPRWLPFSLKGLFGDLHPIAFHLTTAMIQLENADKLNALLNLSPLVVHTAVAAVRVDLFALQYSVRAVSSGHHGAPFSPCSRVTKQLLLQFTAVSERILTRLLDTRYVAPDVLDIEGAIANMHRVFRHLNHAHLYFHSAPLPHPTIEMLFPQLSPLMPPFPL